MSEQWKPVLDGYYEVSSTGELRRAKPGTSTRVGRPVRPILLPNGYVQWSPCVHGKNDRVYAHRLVALAFIGACPEGKEVNHIDGNKANNSAVNLEYVTRSENMFHAHSTGLIRKRPSRAKPRVLKGRPSGASHWTAARPSEVPRGEQLSWAKNSDEDIREMRRLVAGGAKQRDVARRFAMSAAQVSRIVNRTRWEHVK